MRKQFFIIFLVFTYVWSWAIFNAVKADDRITTTTGHIIVETVKGTDIDQMKIIETELEHIMKNLALEVIPLLEAALPLIMDRVMTDLRLELDKQHKCLLLKDSKIKDKDCQ